MTQFYRGGPIIAFQVENEYGSFYADDVKYLEHLKSVSFLLSLVHKQ